MRIGPIAGVPCRPQRSACSTPTQPNRKRPESIECSLPSMIRATSLPPQSANHRSSMQPDDLHPTNHRAPTPAQKLCGSLRPIAPAPFHRKRTQPPLPTTVNPENRARKHRQRQPTEFTKRKSPARCKKEKNSQIQEQNSHPPLPGILDTWPLAPSLRRGIRPVDVRRAVHVVVFRVEVRLVRIFVEVLVALSLDRRPFLLRDEPVDQVST